MWRNRVNQIVALAFMLVALGAGGMLLPRIITQSEDASLRYTSVAVENAPPEVVIGSAIGALRGILVDVLWVRANLMKEDGLYYEANTLAELITRLQPHFAAVWIFHSHNMAYNISVATHTQAERWEWVKKGIDLMRNEAVVFNPNNVELYKDLAYYFLHKIEGVSDDAHLYYKRMLCDEWHKVLGEPPHGWLSVEESERLGEPSPRTEWIKEVADAPISVEALVKKNEKAGELLEKIREFIGPHQDLANLDFSQDFLTREFLYSYSNWKTIQDSPYAHVLGHDAGLRAAAADPSHDEHAVGLYYMALDSLAVDPEYEQAWKDLLAFTRKKVLREDYNMDAKFMYELTRDWGPIDWRHGCAHAFYWSRRGAALGESRSNNDDLVYKIVNNDRMATASMQEMHRFGWIHYDPLAGMVYPDRMIDIRWIEGVEKFFEHLYIKHWEVPGWGSDNFKDFYLNFMKSTIREVYRMGDRAKAEELYDRLDRKFGSGGLVPNSEFSIPLDVFVENQTRVEYDKQPHIATTDVQSALYYAIRIGLGRGRPEMYEEAKEFADKVLTWFKNDEDNSFRNTFGEERITGIISTLENTELAVWGRIMLDPSIDLIERLNLYNVHAPLPIRQALYDLAYAPLRAQVENSPVALADFEKMFVEPPGMAEYRAEQELRRQQQEAEAAGRAEIAD